MNNNEIWVFLSHSNKDYKKVRLVRNMLEEQALRPLMFFLHCLNDDDEIDSLIKREIDSRTRFIDEIVKRVVTQLMTPGSIKVLADNLAKGTFHEVNTEEADFLYGLVHEE